ncbi:MAG TPA: hydrogenase maturation protease [Streptosporangiaceae bacterium]|nr:hydrogenase maturation protease [Streptosporangiaceae bacterium]
MSGRTLVAGIGNIFLGDDGFGAEVVRQLAAAELPPQVTVADYGISGMHLAYDLAGYDTAILVDAVARGGAPGTVYVIEPDRPAGPGDAGAAGSADGGAAPRVSPFLDAHGMQPDVVLGVLGVLGGWAGRVLVVGCEPANTQEGIGLSPAVAGAVAEAVQKVRELVGATGKERSHVPGHTG